MILRKIIMLACCSVLAMVLPGKTFATHTCLPNDPTRPVLTVVIGTETRTENASHELILNDASGAAHTYPNGLTIAPLAGGNAVVRVECDTGGDKLSLMNAKITVNAPVTNQTIVYWATFDTPPLPSGHPTATPQTPPSVWYKLTGVNSGGIASSNASPAAFDKVVAKGEIFNPVPGGTWRTIGSRTKTVTAGAPNPDPFFSSSVSWQWPSSPNLLGERHIRGTVTITLKSAADRVELGGIVIENSATACGNCDPGGTVQPSSWCMTTNSTAVSLGCPSCLTEDGLIAQNKKLELFAATTWPNLLDDMARGHGEHLAALAALMQISPRLHDEFFAVAQEHYSSLLLYDRSLSPEDMIAALQDRWTSRSIVSSIR